MNYNEIIDFIKSNKEKISNMSSVRFDDDILESIFKSIEKGEPINDNLNIVKDVIKSFSIWILNSVTSNIMTNNERDFFNKIMLFFYNVAKLYNMENEIIILESSSKILEASFSFIDMIDVLKILISKLENTVAYSNTEKDAAMNFLEILRK